MAKPGPVPKTINWEQFEDLASMQCTQEEIAAFFKISLDTLATILKRDHNTNLSEYWTKRRFMGRVRLRKAQFGIVERMGPGAAAMAIYLDKKMFPDENPDRPQTNNPPSNEVAKIEMPNFKSFKDFCLDANYFEPFPKQIEMMSFLTDEDVVRLLLGARGYGKTDFVTIMGVAYRLYLAVKNNLDLSECTALIITKSKSRNTAIIKEISEALIKNGVVLEKSNDSVIRVQGVIGQDHSVEALTIKSSMRGRHPKLIVMDDPVTDEDVSEAMRNTVKRRYDEAYKLCKNILIIGQPAHAHDLYAKLRGIVKTMEVPYGSIPQLDADLEAMKIAGVDENSIEMSYHLRVPVSGSAAFAKIKRIDVMPKGKTVAFIDPSDGGDYTAVTIMIGYFDGVACVGFEWKMAWYHCLDEITKKFKEFDVGRVCFETNTTGTQPIIQLKEHFKALQIGVVGKHSDSNKHAVIMQAGSYAQRIHLSKQSGQSYTDHVIQYEYGAKSDDAPDSLARCMEWLGLLWGKK
jgi:hypothetical protein